MHDRPRTAVARRGHDQIGRNGHADDVVGGQESVVGCGPGQRQCRQTRRLAVDQSVAAEQDRAPVRLLGKHLAETRFRGVLPYQDSVLLTACDRRGLLAGCGEALERVPGEVHGDG